MKAFKGFDKNLSCCGFQYEVGKAYKHEGPVILCSSGFHSCIKAIDVWKYYTFGENRYAQVDAFGEVLSHDAGSKIASSDISIITEISEKDFLDIIIAEIFQSADSNADSNLAASGNDSNLAASGSCSNLAASGSCSNLAASGNDSNLAASGNDSKLAASGNDSNLAAFGSYSNLAASGNSSKLAASGNSSKLAASGSCSKLAASGSDAVICSAGQESIAKGIDGTWISLAEFVNNKCVGFATGCIGQNGLLADTWYRAENGKLVPC